MSRQTPAGCSGYQSLPGITRRNTLKAGVLGGLGVSLPGMLRAQATGGAREHSGPAKSVILFWLQGGISHHDTFDPKPLASAGIRGEFHPISTRLPGVQFSNYLPKLAGMADEFAVIRSVTHREAAHERGSMYMVEGRRPGPGASGSMPSGNPQLGCIVAEEKGMSGGLPAFFSIPGNDFTSRFIGHGWLPARTAPFKGTEVKSLEQNPLLGTGRLAERIALRDSLLGTPASSCVPGHADGWDDFDRQALDIIATGRGADAFNLDEETAATKALYGMDQKNSDKGKFALTARRLVEAGVRYVTIGRHSWDHHSTIFPQLRKRLPSMDAAISGLITDLKQRGLFEETLVVYLTEYGRTPRINKDAGRDHWPSAFSVAFAGAGIRPGQVIGATDRDGASVIDRPVSPEEIAATILQLTGIRPNTEYTKPDGRPMQYVDHARPIAELLA